MGELLLSVIVPVYNAAATLNVCAASILDQLPQDSELLLVDDGSTDGCAASATRWRAADARCGRCTSQTGGASAARNAGLAAARGRYLSSWTPTISLCPASTPPPCLTSPMPTSFLRHCRAGRPAAETACPPGPFLAPCLAAGGFSLLPRGDRPLRRPLQQDLPRLPAAGPPLDPALRINEDLQFNMQALARCGAVFFDPPLLLLQRHGGRQPLPPPAHRPFGRGGPYPPRRAGLFVRLRSERRRSRRHSCAGGRAAGCRPVRPAAGPARQAHIFPVPGAFFLGPRPRSLPGRRCAGLGQTELQRRAARFYSACVRLRLAGGLAALCRLRGRSCPKRPLCPPSASSPPYTMQKNICPPLWPAFWPRPLRISGSSWWTTAAPTAAAHCAMPWPRRTGASGCSTSPTVVPPARPTRGSMPPAAATSAMWTPTICSAPTFCRPCTACSSAAAALCGLRRDLHR